MKFLMVLAASSCFMNSLSIISTGSHITGVDGMSLTLTSTRSPMEPSPVTGLNGAAIAARRRSSSRRIKSTPNPSEEG